MSRIFLSHSSADQAEAIAVRDWLVREGWDDLFLDLDPERGLVAGERWQEALKQAAERCEAVLFLISPNWAASKWCLAEFLLAKNLNKQIFGVIISPTTLEDLPSEMTSEWQLVDLTVEPRSEEFAVTLVPGDKTGNVRFSNVGLARLKTGLQKAGLDARYFAWPPEDDPERSPYGGLRALTREDAGIFFGRDGQIVEGLDRMRGLRNGNPPRLLVILGASGAGKSSFMRAGLLPRLARDDRHFAVLPVVRPERAALSGETGWVAALEAGLKACGLPRSRVEVRQAVEAGSLAVADLLGEIAMRLQSRLPNESGDLNPPTIVIPIDQAEELYFAESGREARYFTSLLKDLVGSKGLSVAAVLTMRTDAYELLQQDSDLGPLRHQILNLPPMPIGSYAEVIKGPVRRLEDTSRRLDVDDELVEAILTDIQEGGAKDALPLLAFTLERLYLEYGGDGDLRLQEYDALGRIKGSIEAAVDNALAAADDNHEIPKDRDERLALLRRGFIPWLAGIDPDTRAVRRKTANLSDIPDDVRPLLLHLVDQRLLATDVEEKTGEKTIEPAHEALLRQWGLLQGWLKEDSEALAALDGVRRAATEWEAKGRTVGWLVHTAGRLESAEKYATREDFSQHLRAIDRDYLAAARQEANARRNRELEAQRQINRRTRIGLIAASILAAVAAAAAYWGFDQAKIARGQRVLADNAAADAKSQRDIAEQAASAEMNARKEAEQQSALLAARLARPMIENGELDQALLLLLDAVQAYGQDEVPDDLLISFQQAIDTSDRRTLHQFPLGSVIETIGNAVFIAVPGTDEVYHFDETGNLKRVWVHDRPIRNISRGIDSSSITIIGKDYSVKTVDWEKSTVILDIPIELPDIPKIERGKHQFDLIPDESLLIHQAALSESDQIEAENYDVHINIKNYESNTNRSFIAENSGSLMAVYHFDDTIILKNDNIYDPVYIFDKNLQMNSLETEQLDDDIKDNILLKKCYIGKIDSDSRKNILKKLNKIDLSYGQVLCIIKSQDVLITNISRLSSGSVRRDYIIFDFLDENAAFRDVWQAILDEVTYSETSRSELTFRGNDWIALGGSRKLAMASNRKVFVFDGLGTLSSIVTETAPDSGVFLKEDKLALLFRNEGRITVFDYGRYRPFGLETERGPIDSDDIESANYGACQFGGALRMQMTEYGTRRIIPLFDDFGNFPSKIKFEGSKGITELDTSSFDCISFSPTLDQFIVVDNGEARIHEWKGGTLDDFNPAAGQLIPVKNVSSAFFIASTGKILIANSSASLQEYSKSNNSQEISLRTIYRGNHVIAYAEPSRAGDRVLIVESLDRSGFRPVLYSVAAKAKFLEFEAGYKYQGWSVGLSADNRVVLGETSADRDSLPVFTFPTVREYVEKARSAIRQECQPIGDDYQSSSCWPTGVSGE